MQPVIWCVEFSDGSFVYEFNNNNQETLFTKILPRKSEFISLALLDKVNKISYVICLKTGKFSVNGVCLVPSKEIDGRTLSFANLPISYADGVIQYKCSNPVSPGKSLVTAATYNIGYSVEPPDMYYERFYRGQVTEFWIKRVQPILSINAQNMCAHFSVSMTINMVNKVTGEEKLIKV